SARGSCYPYENAPKNRQKTCALADANYGIRSEGPATCRLRLDCGLATLLFGSQRLGGLFIVRLKRQVGVLRPGYGGLGARVQEACGLQFFLARQVIQRREPEMFQEEVGRAPGHRATRDAAAAHRPDPVLLEQEVERALAETHAAHFLDLGARHRL